MRVNCGNSNLLNVSSPFSSLRSVNNNVKLMCSLQCINCSVCVGCEFVPDKSESEIQIFVKFSERQRVFKLHIGKNHWFAH